MKLHQKRWNSLVSLSYINLFGTAKLTGLNSFPKIPREHTDKTANTFFIGFGSTYSGGYWEILGEAPVKYSRYAQSIMVSATSMPKVV